MAHSIIITIYWLFDVVYVMFIPLLGATDMVGNKWILISFYNKFQLRSLLYESQSEVNIVSLLTI